MFSLRNCLACVVLVLYTGQVLPQVLIDYEEAGTKVEQIDAELWRLAFRPDVDVLQQTALRIAHKRALGGDKKQAVDKLVDASSPGDKVRRYWHAAVIASGRDWTPVQEYFGALALRGESTVADPSHAGAIEAVVVSLYDLPRVEVPIGYEVKLFNMAQSSGAIPEKGDFVATVGAGQLSGTFPARISLDVSDVPDGSFLIVVELAAGEEIDTLATPVYIIRNLDPRFTDIRSQLEMIDGHDQAKAVIQYPYSLATQLRSGTREIISYDFAKALSRSEQVLSELKKGMDRVRGSVGFQDRAYRFPGTDEFVPYQLYIPENWTGKSDLPLVVALHGANLDETNMLGRGEGVVRELARKYGYAVVAPLGYRLNSGYGSQRSVIANQSVSFSQLPDEEQLRRTRSEQDVLNVLNLVRNEYSIDEKRIYLTGNSMGGNGTWWLSIKYPELWTAVVPVAAGGPLPEDVPTLKTIPIMAVIGEDDWLVMKGFQAALANLRKGGAEFEFLEVKGGTHKTAFDLAAPDIFAFFDKHRK